MIIFRVTINNQSSVAGGADDLSVLSAILTATGPLGRGTHCVEANNQEINIGFHLGGLTSRAVGVDNEHVRWLENVELSPGDVVTIEVLEADLADPVTSTYPSPSNEEQERELFKFAKEQYLSLREKYEPKG